MRGVWEPKRRIHKVRLNVRLEEIKSLPSLNLGGEGSLFAVQKKKRMAGWKSIGEVTDQRGMHTQNTTGILLEYYGDT